MAEDNLFLGLDASTQSLKALIVNEKLVEEFGWKNPIGQRVTMEDSVTLKVIGVVKDYHMYGFWMEIGPTAMRVNDEKDNNFVIGKVDLSNLTDAYSYLETEWRDKIPNKT